MRRFIVLKSIVATVLMLLLTGLATANEWQFDGVRRVVAISDIHGDHQAMMSTLASAEVIDADGDWSGGDTNLVIVGDILDRGPDSRQSMDLLMRLEAEALAAGGRVHVLIGNHEAMNLMGDLRYVHRGEYLAFADEETAEERERWFHAYSRRGGVDPDDERRAEFDSEYPPGFFAHRRAFAADGQYGKWLLGKPVMIVIDGTAFVHGGVSPMIADIGLEGVNRVLFADLVGFMDKLALLLDAEVLLPTDDSYDFDKILNAWMPPLDAEMAVVEAAKTIAALGESKLHDIDGPLWYRGNVYCSRLVEEDRLIASLARIGAERVVIGHTPTMTRQLMQRFDGRIIEVDTGMNERYYGGTGHAIVIEGEGLHVVNQNGGEPHAPIAHPRQVGTRGDDFMSMEDLEELLRTGDIVEESESATGRTIVSVSDGENRVNAFLEKRSGRDFYPDVAAYRLDRLLEFEKVPVAIKRKHGRDDVSLQFVPAKILNEQQRTESGRGGGAYCSLPDQWAAMYVFDVLIYNEGRSFDRMLYDLDDWRLLLVGHQQAFAKRKGRPKFLESAPVNVNGAWQRALESVDDETLASHLGDVLDSRRLKALADRRDELLDGK